MKRYKTTRLAVIAWSAERVASRQITPLTARQNRYHLRALCDACPDPAKLSRRHVLKAFGAAADGAAATSRANFSTTKTFLDWAVMSGVIKKNPMLGMRPPKVPRTVPRAMAPADVGLLLSHCAALRTRAIVSLMVQEGLRCKEVAGLTVADVDMRERTVFIANGKGGHQRRLPLTVETRSTVREYMIECPAPPSFPLIRSKVHSNQGLTPATIGKLVVDVIEDAGLKHHKHDGRSAHALRHTAATDILRNGAHLLDVQAFLGHADVSTTRRYLPTTVNNLADVVEGRKYRGAHLQAVEDEEAL